MASVWYATRESVKGALDVAETARNNLQIDRALGSASRVVDGLCKRKFYPWTGTRYFDWPNSQRSVPWRLWLDDNELVSVTTLTAGGVLIAAADYFLEPANSGPPYTYLEIDLASTAAFTSSTTHQRAIAITGVFGYSADEESVGSLAGPLAGSESATASITWTTARFGVGDILRIDSERVIVTERTYVDSTQNTTGALTAVSSDVTVGVASGTAFAVEEVIRVDAEKMLVLEVVGNNLTVKRAWDGSVLATHSSNADVYTLTGVEIDRGQLGTTLAAHLTGATIYRHVVPDLIRDLTIAEALDQLQQEGAGYARTIGEGEGAREGTGRGIGALRRDVRVVHGRRARTRAV